MRLSGVTTVLPSLRIELTMKTNNSIKLSFHHQDRRGAVLLMVMICLLLVSMIGGSVMKLTLTQQRHIGKETNYLQAQFLAESGIERAVAQLSKNAGYLGESWDISAKELNRRAAGEVVITVSPDAGNTSEKRITVVALFPANGGPAQIQKTKSVSVLLK